MTNEVKYAIHELKLTTTVDTEKAIETHSPDFMILSMSIAYKSTTVVIPKQNNRISVKINRSCDFFYW